MSLHCDKMESDENSSEASKTITWSYNEYILQLSHIVPVNKYSKSKGFIRPNGINGCISKWYMHLKPAKNNYWLSIFLSTNSIENDLQKVQFMFFVYRKTDAAFFHMQEGEGLLQQAKSGVLGIEHFLPRFTVHNKSFIPYDECRIKCQVTISRRDKTIQEGQLSKDLASIFKAPIFSDVIMVINDEEIPAHKEILSARSSVFKAMFTNDMLESKTNRVRISGIDYKVFKEMLRFIYTDEAPNIEVMAQELLAAADQYDLHQLKTMCAEELSDNLSVDNALDILILSNRYSNHRLMNEAINFIAIHIKKFIETDRFTFMTNSYPELATKIMSKMVHINYPDLHLQETSPEEQV